MKWGVFLKFVRDSNRRNIAEGLANNLWFPVFILLSQKKSQKFVLFLLLRHKVERIETVFPQDEWTGMCVIHQPESFSIKSELAEVRKHPLGDIKHLRKLELCLGCFVEPFSSILPPVILKVVQMRKYFKSCCFVGIFYVLHFDSLLALVFFAFKSAWLENSHKLKHELVHALQILNFFKTPLKLRNLDFFPAEK